MSDIWEKAGAGNCLNYKGYTGSVEYSGEDAVFHGRVLGVGAMISFEGDSVSSITKDFRSAVDEYLQFCADRGTEPETAKERAAAKRMPIREPALA